MDSEPDEDHQGDYPDFAVARLSSSNGPAERQDPPSGRAETAGGKKATTRPASESDAGDASPKIGLAGSQETQLLTIAVKRERELTFKEPCERISVQNPEVAQIRVLSPTRVAVSAETIGTTQLTVDSGGKTLSFLVVVEPNLDLLRELIASIAPTANIQLRAVNGSILLTGRVPDAETSELIEQVAKAGAGGDLISHLQVAGVQQTMLRVVIAEVNKEALRELGVNWAIGGSTWSRDFFMANNVAQINPTAFGSSGLSDVLSGQQLYSVAATANGANTNLTFGFPRAEMQWFLNALRQNGLARTLAEPNLVAFSGQTATFLAGGEVPIPVAQSGSATGAITITYKEFGVRLAFTPTILGGQLIRLHVMS
ncbi:pilus assembly protein N-terminal domain-containing protein, partial [Candidatus Bipolaricaulota bacterium]|nr:pilus assembly protein N-terminal domain-containing protein [Candidatus Bipolaricaulota bacterium]